MAGATSIIQLILKKWGDDAAGAAKELEEKVGYPESVANRIATGELPMDAESVAKRADEQGYGPVLYRGHPINRPPRSDKDMWMTDSYDVANTYRRGGEYYDEATDSYLQQTGSVTPLRHNASNVLEIDADGADFQDVGLLQEHIPKLDIEDAYDVLGDDIGSEVVARGVKDWGDGNGGVRFKNMIDDFDMDMPDATERPSNVENIFGSRPDVNIRHADAAFDPEYTGSNIMGGLALPAAAGLLAAGQSEDADAGGATSLVQLILKKFGDDVDGATQELVRMGGYPEPVAKRIATGELPMDEASRVARREARYADEGLVHVNRGGIEGEGFDNSRLPTDDPDTPFNAHWFTTDPHPTSSFRKQGSDDPLTYTPVVLERGRRGDWRDVVEFGESPNGIEAGYGTKFREGLLDTGVSDIVVRGGDKIDQSTIDALPVGGRLRIDPDNKYGDRRNSLVKNDDGSLGFYEGSEHILDYDDLADYQRFNPEIKDVAVLDNTIVRSPNAAFDPQYKGSNIMGNAKVPMLATTAALTAGLLAAPMIKDSGMISSPRSETLFDLTMGARDLERRLEDSPASLLFPSGLVEYLETVNRREEDPNAMTRGMALLDVLPF